MEHFSVAYWQAFATKASIPPIFRSAGLRPKPSKSIPCLHNFYSSNSPTARHASSDQLLAHSNTATKAGSNETQKLVRYKYLVYHKAAWF